MTDSKLRGIAHYAEIIAAIAVVVSLVYVGRQVQDNTAAIKSASVQAIADSSDAALRETAADEDLSRIRFVGDADPESLSDLDAFRYLMYNRGQWIRMQNIFAQRQLGVLDDIFWDSYSKIICGLYTTPGINKDWPKHAGDLNDEFVQFVESCVD